MDHTWVILWILLVSAAVSSIYAYILNRLEGQYSPRWTWLTVVIGNAMIGAVIAAFCALGVLPWLAFQLLLAVNLAMGAPIIIWQLSLDQARAMMARLNEPPKKESPTRATPNEKRPGDDRPAALRPGER